VVRTQEEEQLWSRALPLIKKGRPGDVEHTRSALALGKKLLAKEGGNPRIVIPALILHDVGWSRVNYADFITAEPDVKKDTESIKRHMRYGAQIATDILNDLGWEPDLVPSISGIIAVHDAPDVIQSMNDLNATLVFEADWLDKYSPDRQEVFLNVVKDHEALEELKQFLDANKSQWFRTKAARELLHQITSGQQK
jgi:HD superfamily phosphodiesterase